MALILLGEQSGTPTTPAAGNWLLYPKAGGWYSMDDAGVETLLGSSVVKASGAELDTGTDDAKFATAKAIKDSNNVPSVAPGTSGNVMTSDGTNWTSEAAAGGSGATPHAPGGRLTLVSSTPVMTTEQAAKTSIYYTPHSGDLVPLYNGTIWTETTFTQLTLALDPTSGHTGYHQSGKIFDLFVYLDGATLRLVSGPAWTNDTTRATALEYVNGVLMNAASMTARYGSGVSDTVTVAQDRGTYVGTFRASANGTTTWEIGGTASGGDPAYLYLTNEYNKVLVGVIVKESDDSWDYSTNTWRSKNNSTNNRISFVRANNNDAVFCILTATTGNSGGTTRSVGIGLDVTNAVSGIPGFHGGASGVVTGSFGVYSGLPGIGFHFLQALELGAAANTTTFYGDGSQPLNSGSGISANFLM